MNIQRILKPCKKVFHSIHPSPNRNRAIKGLKNRSRVFPSDTDLLQEIISTFFWKTHLLNLHVSKIRLKCQINYGFN